MNPKEFEKLKKELEEFYSAIEFIKCPALNAKIYLTSEGFNHLRYSKKKARSIVDQVAKFKLLKRAKMLLEQTTTIQEYSERDEEIHKKRHKKVSKEWSVVGYWGFIAIINGVRLKVVAHGSRSKQQIFKFATKICT